MKNILNPIVIIVLVNLIVTAFVSAAESRGERNRETSTEWANKSKYDISTTKIPYDVATNTLVVMEKTVKAKCKMLMLEWRSTFPKGPADLSSFTGSVLSREAMREEIMSVFRGSTQDYNDRIEDLRGYLKQFERTGNEGRGPFVLAHDDKGEVFFNNSTPTPSIIRNSDSDHEFGDNNIASENISSTNKTNAGEISSGRLDFEDQGNVKEMKPCETSWNMGDTLILPNLTSLSRKDADLVHIILEAHYLSIMYDEFSCALLNLSVNSEATNRIPTKAAPSWSPAQFGGETNANVLLKIQWHGPYTKTMPEVGFASEGQQKTLKTWGLNGPLRWVTVLSAGESQVLSEYVSGGGLGVVPVKKSPDASVQQYVVIWRLADGQSEYYPIGWAETNTVKVLKGLQQRLGDEAKRTIAHVLEKTGPRFEKGD